MARARRRPNILVADDEPAIREALRLVLEDEYEIVEAADGEEVVRMVLSRPPDVLLLDIRMPRMSGLDALARIREAGSDVPILMISGHASIATAVEALRLGAQDFLEKPLEREIVLRRIENVLERARLREAVVGRAEEEQQRYQLIGDGERMAQISQLIERAGPTQATVLITGESGTGKELVARAIHQASQRVDGPFIKVNCAAIPDDLIESELFGHEKGSFTGATNRQKGRFARAHSGTIFLDEIGDMSMKTQAKVLRALQDGEIEPVGAGQPVRVDVRVLAATNKDLRDEIDAGRFREDLYYRLSTIPITLPPLRERSEDVPLLARYFLDFYSRKMGRQCRGFTEAAMRKLTGYGWPGNVREMRNAVERAVLLGAGPEIDAAGLLLGAAIPGTGQEGAPAFQLPPEGCDLADVERQLIEQALARTQGNQTRAAELVGLTRDQIRYKIEKYELN